MDHLEVWEMEMRSEAPDKKWNAFLNEVERHLGLEQGSMDGNEAEDGYSLDTAYDAFRAGISPADYAKGERAT